MSKQKYCIVIHLKIIKKKIARIAAASFYEMKWNKRYSGKPEKASNKTYQIMIYLLAVRMQHQYPYLLIDAL